MSAGRCALFALALLVVSPAVAQSPSDPRARASALQAEGLRALDRHDAALALEKFRAAYALVPSPKILFNLGRAYADVGRDDLSFECFDRFLAEAANMPPWSLVDAERMRSQLRPKLGFVELVGPAGAPVTVDGDARGALPLPRPLPLLPGRHTVRVQAEERQLAVAPGVTTRLAITPPAPAPRPLPVAVVPRREPPPPQWVAKPQPPPQEETSIAHRWWFWPAVGTVVVGSVVAVIVATSTGRNAGCPDGRRCM